MGRYRSQFESHGFSSEHNLDVGIMDRECTDYGALHVVDESINTLTSSEPGFSTRRQHGKFKFTPLSKVLFALLQLLTTADTASRQLRENLYLYSAVVSMASMVANWIERGQVISKSSSIMTLQRKVSRYNDAVTSPEQIKYPFASF